MGDTLNDEHGRAGATTFSQNELWRRSGHVPCDDTEIGRGRLPRIGGSLEPGARPDVTIEICVYNASRYIEQCLKSVANQKTEYSFEVLVGEDCSKDDTRALLKRLEAELPENFVFFYRQRNYGAIANGQDLYARARGRYFASLEGDDFWLYDGKLQEQVSFLDANPEYSACYTNCLVVGEDGKANGERYPECPDEEYSWREYFYSCMPGQYGTMVCRRKELLAAYWDYYKILTKEKSYYPGDRRIAFLLLVIGRIHCIQQPWSAYRHVVKKGGSNYSSTVTFDDSYARSEIGFGKSIVTWANLHGSAEAKKVARETYWRFRLKWAMDKRDTSHALGETLHDLVREPGWPALLLAPLRWYVVLGLRKLRGRPVDL